MPIWPKSKRRLLTALLSLITLLIVLPAAGCNRHPQKASTEVKTEKTDLSTPAGPQDRAEALNKPHGREEYAAWYDVPKNSRVGQRGKGELTAASDHLRLGTMVRVTHLANGKSVVVRITDRLVNASQPRASIDMSKEAAQELGMVSEGLARVQMEVLPDDKGIKEPDTKSTAAQP